MKSKKPESRRWLKKALLVLALLLLAGGVWGGSVAYLTARSGSTVNTFVEGRVACTVNSDYSVTNDGNIPAYIRAAAVVNWVDSNGRIRGQAPVEGMDFTLSCNTAGGWTQIGAYCYYSAAVAPGTSTAPLCAIEEKGTAPQGYTLEVQIVVEAIQSQGTDDEGGTSAAFDAWGVSFSNE